MIGELDLFQKEHELSTLLAKCQPTATKAAAPYPENNNGQPRVFPTPPQSADMHDGPADGNRNPATPYEGQSVGSAENGSFNGSFDEDTSNNGFENPSFRYLHHTSENGLDNVSAGAGYGGSQEIVLIQDGELSGETQKYLQDNSEIVTLRCKDTQRQSVDSNFTSIGLGGIGNDNLIVQPGGVKGGAGGPDPKGGIQRNSQPQQQRLSSFKMDVGQQSPQRAGQAAIANHHNSPTSHGDHGHNHQLPSANDGAFRNMESGQMVVQVSPDGKLRSKPTVSPRPTSLSGSFFIISFYLNVFSVSLTVSGT